MDILDTIAAIATPLGRGGIGIVRVSGPKSRDIGQRLFFSAREGFSGFSSHVLHHGWVLAADRSKMDEVLLSFMPGPASYTGEDVLEVNCHGGPAVVQAVLERILDLGARLAQAGEFTLRAYLNGRMDLSQAEAVAEIVGASTQVGLSMAETKLEGGLRRVIQGLRHDLQGILAQMMASVDFPEETEDEALGAGPLQEKCVSTLGDLRASLNHLLDAAQRYRCYREGALVVLAGRVNAGKSSLLNALLGRSRAIVTAIPGTTRDYLEEGINLQGVPVRLVDTAGLRQTEDEVERAGLEQGEDLMQRADLVCLVFDHSLGLDQEVREVAQRLGPEKILAVANKQDLPQKGATPQGWFEDLGFTCLPVSAKSGQGVEDLARAMRERLVGHAPEPATDELVPNLRQQNILLKARQALEEAAEALQENMPVDIVLVPLQTTAEHLAEITGEICTEDVLDQIFSSFCIGK